jgi:glycosyltransferase involved in cell wall biosynthesis
MNISVVIPVFNEKDTIAEIIKRVLATKLISEIVVVDDGSSDGTKDILQKVEGTEYVRIFYHDNNLGKGAAVMTGIHHTSGDIIIIQDADLEYHPKEYSALLQPIQEDLADMVFGSRFLGAPRRPTMFWHMVANKLLTLTTNILYNNILTDMETGYKVFRKSVLNGISIRAKGFEFEPEFTAKVLKKKIRIYEVPISFTPRSYSEGKKIRLRDAFLALWILLKYRFVN